MRNLNLKSPVFLFSLFLMSASVFAQNKYAGSNATEIKRLLDTDTIYSNSTLKETISKIPSFSLLNSAYAIIDFDSLIENEEMVTVFVVKNSAFSDLSKEEREELFTQENKANLVKIISYYIIPGRVDEHAILKAIETGNGSANFRTLDGKNLSFKSEGQSVYLQAGDGAKSKLLQTNYRHSKGFFHVTSGLALPKPTK